MQLAFPVPFTTLCILCIY